MLGIGFAGTFAACLEEGVRARLDMPCHVIVADEVGMVPQLAAVDVLVTMAFTREMASAATRLKLVQVPGAGLDRIDRSALPEGVFLANAYGHETGIAEYVLGAMLALTRGFVGLDAALRRGTWESQWAVGAVPPPGWPELSERPSASLATGGSASAWPDAPARSTWRSVPFAATSGDRQRTRLRSWAVWRFSTPCSSGPIIW
jgi:D-isomer specific 2-hydroxyacid dehydrogenase, catalytic domain